MSVRWHLARAAEVPGDDGWLAGSEHDVLAGLKIAKRRADWRLGRWTAKALITSVLGVPPERVEVRAADGGAPEALIDGAPAGVSLSLSHRDGVAVAAVAPLPTRVGIDLETLEPRSGAFVREWLADDEQRSLPDAGPARDVRVLGCWTGKEASAKVLREGLRLDVRHAVVGLGSPAADWAPLDVTWQSEKLSHRGWWRVDAGRVISVVTDPPTGPPVAVAAEGAAPAPGAPRPPAL